jgi:hypothetical protein
MPDEEEFGDWWRSLGDEAQAVLRASPAFAAMTSLCDVDHSETGGQEQETRTDPAAGLMKKF